MVARAELEPPQWETSNPRLMPCRQRFPACSCAAAPRAAPFSTPPTCPPDMPTATACCWRDGLARPAPDRRPRRRRPADQQGRDRSQLDPARRRPRLPVRAGADRQGIVDTTPNCGNMLAGVGAVRARDRHGRAARRRRNAAGAARSTPSKIETSRADARRRSDYNGDARIDGVPGTAAPIVLNFLDAAGSVCRQDAADRQRASTRSTASKSPASTTACRWCMMRAGDVGRTGYESLEAAQRRHRAEGAHRARSASRPGRDGLGDVTSKSGTRRWR